MDGPQPAWNDLFAFRFRGGTLCLNLVATIGWRDSPDPVERLSTPADLERWIVESGLATVSPRLSEESLIEVRRLREAIYRIAKVVLKQGSLEAKDLNKVNRWARMPKEAAQLVADEKGFAIRHSAKKRIDSLITEIAQDAVRLLGGPPQARIKRCAREDCSLFFVDESRSGRRRWCSMNACGNRAKTVAYRRRVKTTVHGERSAKATR